MPPSPVAPVQQDFLNALQALSPEERTIAMQWFISVFNGPGHRAYQMKLSGQFICKMKPAWWNMLDVHQGKARIVINLVNGSIANMEVTDHN